MKKRNKIIGYVLTGILILTGSTFPPSVYAAELTPAEKSCEPMKPDYVKIKKSWQDAKQKNSKAYQENFEMAQNSYHDYVGCLFEYVEEEILQRSNKARDWLSPKSACLDSVEIKRIINDTAPTQMIGPVLQAHTDYKNYLNELGKGYSDGGTEVDSKGQLLTGAEQLMAKNAFFGKAERDRQMEIDSSLVAIDLMFTSQKELRLAFVMHVHFQCTLKFLEKYRLELGNLRKLITPLPDQLRDASIQ